MSSPYMCQCCLAQDCTKDIFSEYYCNGQKEIYSEMLQNTFNIIMIPNDTKILNNICEQCITDLRNATAFKAKVMEARRLLVGERVPTLEGLEQYDDDDFDDKISVSFDDELADVDGNDKGHIFYINVKQRNNIDNDVNREDPEVQDEEIININENDNLELTIDLDNEKTTEDDNKVEIKKMKIPESQNHKDLKQNSLALVFNSNLCLFKSLKTKFGCFVCNVAYFTIKELRQHSKIHSETKVIQSRFNRLRGLSYQNADISSLECNKCEQPCFDLNDLKKHLIIEHGVKFGDGTHFLIPYKLEDSFNCVVCDEKFNTYMTLSVHMNKHYSNNVCEICGNSYINRMSLRIHLQSQHKENKCSICPEKTFLNHYARIRHMRTAHNSCFSKRYCLICGVTFRYTYQLIDHRVQEHGLKRQLSKCTICSKSFNAAHNLKIHVRAVHIRERNFPCSECEMRFFSKFDQKRHELTHNDERSFACSYCESRFKGKDCLRKHLKKQHGHINKRSNGKPMHLSLSQN